MQELIQKDNLSEDSEMKQEIVQPKLVEALTGTESRVSGIFFMKLSTFLNSPKPNSLPVNKMNVTLNETTKLLVQTPLHEILVLKGVALLSQPAQQNEFSI
jgi:hypothetical protein